MKKRILNKLHRDEAGQILMMVLLLMLFGSLIAGSVLPFMGTGLKVGKEVYEEKMYRFYAADAGVEDALWQIKNDQLSSRLAGYDEYKYDYPYYYPGYPNSLVLNNKNVGVSVENVWVPPTTGAGSIPVPSTSQEALNIAKYGNTTGESQVAPRLIITGNPSQTSPATKYQIGITYYYGTEGTDTLYVKSIGIWLPPGFHYNGNHNLTGASVDNHSYKGGEVVVWTFSPYPKFKSLPGVTTTNPMVSNITFDYKADTAGQTPSCVSWISTSGDASKVGSIPYAWDADKKVYGINSVAKDADTEKNVTVDAYALKTDPRELGSGRSGDYVAIGNSLMMPDTSDPTVRNRLLKESSATVSSGSGVTQIPANATVQAAYLYWSGFIDHYYWYWYTKPPGPGPASGWYFSSDSDNATGTVYNASNLSQLITNSKVNTVSFGTTGAMQNITADQWQVCLKTNDSPNCWYYTCLYDATDLVQQLIENGNLGANGSGTYTLGHVSGVINQTPPRNITISFPRTPSLPSSDHTSPGYSFTLYNSSGNPTSDYTGYPLGTPATKLPGDSSYNPNKQIPATGNTANRYNASYAGWSLVVIYSSPDTQGHQLYLYDIKNPNFTFKESFGSDARCDMDFDGDGNPGGNISGFLVPQKITGETNAARITCFVGEGDVANLGDFIAFNAPSSYWSYPADLNIPNTYKLWDGITCTNNSSSSPNNVWNSMFLPLTSAAGVDIDNFYVTWASNLLRTGYTSAHINLPSPGDGITLSYMILSFRSTVITGGTISYLVR